MRNLLFIAFLLAGCAAVISEVRDVMEESSPSEKPGNYVLHITINEPALEIWYKSGNMEDFKSTGFMGIENPATGKPMPQYQVSTRRLEVGNNTVLVRYRNIRDETVGPIEASVFIKSRATTDAENFVQYMWSNPVLRGLRVRWYMGSVAFSFMWYAQPDLFREVRYSLDNDRLSKYWIKDGKRSDGREEATLEFGNLKAGERTLFVQFALVNGWQSEVLRYEIEIKEDGEWYEYHPSD